MKQISKFLLEGLHHPFLLFLFLRAQVAGVVGDNFAHLAHHVAGQLTPDEVAVAADCQGNHDQQRANCEQQHSYHVFVTLGYHCGLLESFFAIFRRGGQALADGQYDVVDIEVALVDHAVDCHLGEAVEPHLHLSDLPRAQGIVDGVEKGDIVHPHHLKDRGCAIFKGVPISIAIFIEEVHITHPFLSPSLRENGLLMDLLSQYQLPYFLLPVLEVVAAEVEEAVIVVASLTRDSMVYGFDIDVSLQMGILFTELSQENVGAVLGG